MSCVVRLLHLPGSRWHQGGLTKTGRVLHEALGEVLGVTLEVADVIRPPRMKPRLDPVRRPELGGVDFSIAASGPWVGLAILVGGRVGIDIEVERRFDLTPELRALVFHPAETGPEVPDDVVSRRQFFEVWTRKEAVLKAAGLGLSMKPAEIRLEGDRAWMPDGTGWYVRRLTGPEGLALAVACSFPVDVVSWGGCGFGPNPSEASEPPGDVRNNQRKPG
jgi:hypothetical protein